MILTSIFIARVNLLVEIIGFLDADKMKILITIFLATVNILGEIIGFLNDNIMSMNRTFTTI